MGEQDTKEKYKTIEAKVLGVRGFTKESYVTTRRRIGPGPSSREFAGYNSSLEIEIESDSPVKILTFDTILPIEVGDTIRATLPMIKESALPYWEYKDKLNEKEYAIKIEKVRDGKVVAEYSRPAQWEE